MAFFYQHFASLAIRIIQKYGPHTVEVLGRTYVVTPDVFNPKFYVTSEFMARHVRVQPEDKVLDMGTGSGILAIRAGETALRVTAVDINPQAVRCARENVARNGLADRISVLQGDLFSALPSGAQFDVIFFSPPYLEGEAKERLDQALYDPGKELARRFLKEAGNYLKPNGYIQMAYSSIAEPERVLKIAGQLGWSCRVAAERKGLIETIFIWKLTREK